MKKLKRNVPRLITVGMSILLFTAVVLLMSHVQRLLYSDVEINLTEVVTQNKDVINSKLMLEVNNLDMVASQIAERMTLESGGATTDQALKAAYKAYQQEARDADLFVATAEGEALFADGTTRDISGRQYFRLAAEGKQNISDRVVSRLDGEEMFVISVPLNGQDGRLGTVQKMYTVQAMYDLCTLSLFSSQGFMYVINSDGYILVSSHSGEYNREYDNLYRIAYAQGNQQQSKILENDIRARKSGFMEMTIDGEKVFSAYTPIEDLHDWYLISCVATSAVSPNAHIVIKMFYVVLFVVVLIFAVSLLWFWSYKKRRQDQLEHIAFVDTVTGGNTYNKFEVDVRRALAENPRQQYSILSFDIDNFKYINSYYGFDVGDRWLKQITRALAEKLLPGETIARISGDQFVLLLTEASPERTKEMMQSMRSADGGVVHFSAGLYHISDRSESVNLIVDKASTAKQSIKGVFHKRVEVYTEDFGQAMIHREQVKRAIERAIIGDEIVAFYQPKVDVNTRALRGAEVLARWRTAGGKLISPGEFIPICEKTGMIVELDMIIFEKTLRFLKRNLDAGVPGLPISVNFSRLHLNNPNFLETVVQKLREYGVPPRLIEVELTESVMLENYEIILDFTKQLHEAGLQIAMDDFGSGYSSLNMLKDIPIDILKIDRGFLQQTGDGEKRHIILASIAHMARQLNMSIVVEGVETEQNVETMRQIGCSVAQGFYFARPMEESAFEEIYKEGTV